MVVRASRRLPANQRRETILKAAMAVLSEKGYSGMTTARIARNVGVAEPILYRHFPSKAAMLRALLDDVIARMMTAFQLLVQDESDPVAALRLICREYPKLSERYRHEFRIINQALVQAKDTHVRKMLADHYQRYHLYLVKLIEQGQQAGDLRRDIPADIAAWHVIQAALGFLILEDIRPGARSEKNLQHLADAVLGGLMTSA